MEREKNMTFIKRKSIVCSAFLLLCTSFFVQSLIAQSSDEDPIASIRAVIEKTQPNMQVTDITASRVSGLYEITMSNGQTLFASEDARFFIPGDLYEAMPEGLVNLGEQKRNVLRADKIAAVPESEMIIFEPEDGRKATVTVFTDVDCPYCRQLHGEMSRLNELGIAVRYLGYPRTGLDTETHHKMISAWCADDPNAMFTSATRGGTIPETECDNPIAGHYQLGREVGVTGTPALVLEDGTILPGYVPADTLAGYLLGTAQ
jgi:thiol:disulfide interchange protein DsbC